MDEKKLTPARIGLLLHSDHAHHRKIAIGAVEYSRTNKDVKIVGEQYRPLISWERLSEFDGDGLVAIANSYDELDQLKRTKIPFVLAGSRILDDNLTVIASDNREIGKMAAEHLIACGLKNFLFVGSRRWDDERLRFEGFRDAIQNSGLQFEVADDEEINFVINDVNELHLKTVARMEALLTNVARPLGVFCPNSLIARMTLFAADAVGIVVPDELALLAVNSDPILCETTDPPLSGVIQNSNHIGFLAAKTLVEMLSGHDVKSQMVVPNRVSIRRSSDMLMVGDPSVEKALRFLRDRAHQSVEISDIADHVGVSRRTLELRFRETLKSSPHQELLRIRLEMAKSLLLESGMPVTQIALGSGFGSSQVFSTVFKKQTGMTPSQFRGQNRP